MILFHMQKMLALTKGQRLLAKDLWRRSREELAGTTAERQAMLANLQTMGGTGNLQSGMQPEMVPETMEALGMAARLAENSATHKEIMLHCHRQFVLQVSCVQQSDIIEHDEAQHSAMTCCGPDEHQLGSICGSDAEEHTFRKVCGKGASTACNNRPCFMDHCNSPPFALVLPMPDQDLEQWKCPRQ